MCTLMVNKFSELVFYYSRNIKWKYFIYHDDHDMMQMLDDFVDVTKDEKQIMHLWNSFVRKQRLSFIWFKFL